MRSSRAVGRLFLFGLIIGACFLSAGLVRAEEGDFRPWSEISTWAESIAQQLRELPAAP